MTHSELVDLALKIHVSVAFLSVGAYYQFGERSKSFKETQREHQELSDRILDRLVADLARRLEPVLRSFPGPPSTSRLLDQAGDSIPSEPAWRDPIDNERGRSALQGFLERNTDFVPDYCALIRAKAIWLSASKGRSWCALLLLAWQVLVVAGIGVMEKFAGYELSTLAVQASLGPTVVLPLCFLAASALIMRQDDRVMQIRGRSDAP